MQNGAVFLQVKGLLLGAPKCRPGPKDEGFSTIQSKHFVIIRAVHRGSELPVTEGHQAGAGQALSWWCSGTRLGVSGHWTTCIGALLTL